MAGERTFKIALLVSVGMHSILLIPFFGLFGAQPKNERPIIEVTYLKFEEKVIPEPIRLLPDKKVTLEDVKTEEPKTIDAATKMEKAPTKAEPPNIMEYAAPLQKGASDVLNYIRAVRSWINDFIRENYSPFMGEGEAVMHFVLNSDGSVDSIEMLENDVGANKRLRELCTDSILLSSPFKPFPESLDLPQASFNISISFKRR